MTFTRANQVLIVTHDHKSGRYIQEADVSKIYATPMQALEAVDYDTAIAFVIMDYSQNCTTRDVTEQVAKAYIDHFEPEEHEHVPIFVEQSAAWVDYLADMEAPVNIHRQYSTMNHVHQGIAR